LEALDLIFKRFFDDFSSLGTPQEPFLDAWNNLVGQDYNFDGFGKHTPLKNESLF